MAPLKDLSKRKLGQFAKSMAAAQAAFRAEVDKLAESARTEMLPYFRAQGLDYMTGMGIWCISKIDEDREVLIEDKELPLNIRELLLLEVATDDYLGLYMRDIKRGEW